MLVTVGFALFIGLLIYLCWCVVVLVCLYCDKIRWVVPHLTNITANSMCFQSVSGKEVNIAARATSSSCQPNDGGEGGGRGKEGRREGEFNKPFCLTSYTTQKMLHS